MNGGTHPHLTPPSPPPGAERECPPSPSASPLRPLGRGGQGEVGVGRGATVPVPGSDDDRHGTRPAGAGPERQGLAFQGGRGAPEAHRRQDAGEGLCAVRDRVRPLGPAPHRHVRRGRAHDHGAPRLRDALRHPDAPRHLLGRHGRAAQGARQHPRTCDGRAASRQAAHPDPRPLRHAREFWGPQQRAVARLPRRLRLRLHLQELERGLSFGRVRRRAPGCAAPLRRDHAHHPADARGRAAGDLQPIPAALPEDRPRAAGADHGPRRGRGHRELRGRGRRGP